MTEHFVLRRFLFFSKTNIMTQDPRDRTVVFILKSAYNNYSKNGLIVFVDEFFKLFKYISCMDASEYISRDNDYY